FFTRFTKRIPEVIVREGVIRVDLYCLPESGNRLINPVAGLQGGTKVCIDLCTFRTVLYSLIKQSDGSFMIILLVQEQAQHVKGIGIPGVELQNLAVKCFSLLQPSRPVVLEGDIKPVLDIPALTLESCTLPAFTHLLFSRASFSGEIDRIMRIQSYLIFLNITVMASEGKSIESINTLSL
ncbi:MAG: hypothetical protein OET63_05445, partial [Desulfobacterales bacterium]|nr:hypothetical protein [Desulfobacterales bacterium]